MAQLLKPDMPAALERTHLAQTFDALLLPIYEAGSNAIHALLEKFGATDIAVEGKLTFAFSIGTRPDEFAVTVSDNGDGLDDRNYLAFLTSFTGNKLKRGGKGFGRFVAFKVFDEVSYYSKTPSSAGAVETRSFRFDVYAAEEIIDVQGGIAHEFETGCAVTYRRVKAAYALRLFRTFQATAPCTVAGGNRETKLRTSPLMTSATSRGTRQYQCCCC